MARLIRHPALAAGAGLGGRAWAVGRRLLPTNRLGLSRRHARLRRRLGSRHLGGLRGRGAGPPFSDGEALPGWLLDSGLDRPRLRCPLLSWRRRSRFGRRGLLLRLRRKAKKRLSPRQLGDGAKESVRLQPLAAQPKAYRQAAIRRACCLHHPRSREERLLDPRWQRPRELALQAKGVIGLKVRRLDMDRADAPGPARDERPAT